ncbi:hypothetical protein HF319_01195 [Xanthomonas sp. Kuri4-1]
MAVSGSSRRREYQGDGVTTTFAGPVAFEAAQLQVFIVNSASVALQTSSAYGLDGLGSADGTRLVMATAPAPTDRLVILRVLSYSPPTNIESEEAFSATAVERIMDSVTMQIQQLADRQDRSIRFPEVHAGNMPDLTLPIPESGKVLGWNEEATGLCNISLDGTRDLELRGDVNDEAGAAAPASFRQAASDIGTRSVLEKLSDIVSIRDFYDSGDGQDWLPAFNRAISYLSGVGGGRLYLPSGTYDVSGHIDISGIDNLWIDGCGQDNTVVRTTSATSDLFYSNADRKYRKFSNFTAGSTVVKTAGAMFNFLAERRSIIEDVKVTGWFYGINFSGFEEVELHRVKIVNPSGSGVALSLGTKGSFGSGANMHVVGCFFRGNDDMTQAAPIAYWGVQAYDIDALYMLDTDIGGFVTGDLRVDAAVRAANFYFTSCFFDATRDSNCVTITGPGAKQQWSIVGCWFASAGKLPGGSSSACGLFMDDAGSYSGIQFTGCRFFANSGAGVYQSRIGSVQFVGCSFQSNGTPTANYRYGYMYAPTTASMPGPLLSGCRFDGNSPKAVFLGELAREVTMSGNTMDNGMDFTSGTLSYVHGFDKTSRDVASAATIAIQPSHCYVVVTGTNNIAGITATFPGHQVTLKFNGILTVIDNSQNLRLASNFTVAANSTLTLICDGAEWQEVARSNN